MGSTLVNTNNVPFEWADFSSYRNSNAFRKEIYLKNQENKLESLVLMFYTLFKNQKGELKIYNKSWWDFCIDTWDVHTDEYNYEPEGKSDESKDYLQLLKDSHIALEYSGFCKCENWDKFLHVTLQCILNYKAPYSHLFCDFENNFFFYFHHTGSIGIYYKEKNEVVEEILSKANQEYDVID